MTLSNPSGYAGSRMPLLYNQCQQPFCFPGRSKWDLSPSCATGGQSHRSLLGDVLVRHVEDGRCEVGQRRMSALYTHLEAEWVIVPKPGVSRVLAYPKMLGYGHVRERLIERGPRMRPCTWSRSCMHCATCLHAEDALKDLWLVRGMGQQCS